MVQELLGELVFHEKLRTGYHGNKSFVQCRSLSARQKKDIGISWLHDTRNSQQLTRAVDKTASTKTPETKDATISLTWKTKQKATRY